MNIACRHSVSVLTARWGRAKKDEQGKCGVLIYIHLLLIHFSVAPISKQRKKSEIKKEKQKPEAHILLFDIFLTV